MPYIKCKDLDYLGLVQTFKSMEDNSFEYMTIESDKNNTLTHFEKNVLADLKINSACFFSKSGELKIRKLSTDKYRCVYVGEKNLEIGLDDYHKLELTNSPKTDRVILWGKRLGHQLTFVEQEIPNYFDYPVSKNSKKDSRVILHRYIYKNDANEIEYVRNSHIEEMEEAELCL